MDENQEEPKNLEETKEPVISEARAKYLKKTGTYISLITIYCLFSFVIVFFALPVLFWDISSRDLFYIVQHPDDLGNRFTELMANLNLTEQSLYEWARDKLIIVAIVTIVIAIIVICLLSNASKHFRGEENERK